jgi:hypothetical protein
MKARKQLSLEELFRLYPQLRQASYVDAGQAQDGQMARESRSERSSDQTERACLSSGSGEV